MLLGPAWLLAADDGADPRVAKVVAGIMGIDMHNHVYPAGTEPHPRGQGDQLPSASLDMAQEIKRSGLTAVCASFVLDFTPGDPHANFLHWLAAIDEQLAKDGMSRALNLRDLQVAHDQGKPVIVQTVEGAQFIAGRLDRVEQAYERGLRHLQLLHEKDDAVSPLGDVNTRPSHLGGLTAFGAEIVRECNRLGIVVDLAHASNETVLGAVKVSTQPFIVSHTSLDTRTGKNPMLAKMMLPRLISKEHARVVADAGGVIGVWTHMSDTLKEMVEGIRAMVDAVGIDHVGIGTDTDLLSARANQSTNRAYPDLAAGFFAGIVGEMLRQGFTTEEIEKIGGGNFCRVFEKVTAGRS